MAWWSDPTAVPTCTNTSTGLVDLWAVAVPTDRITQVADALQRDDLIPALVPTLVSKPSPAG